MEQARWMNGPSSEWRRANNLTDNSNHQTYFDLKTFILDLAQNNRYPTTKYQPY